VTNKAFGMTFHVARVSFLFVEQSSNIGKICHLLPPQKKAKIANLALDAAQQINCVIKFGKIFQSIHDVTV
jgi:hypothetical protein